MEGSLIEQRSGHDAKAIEARQAEIVGKPQRIEALSAAEMTGDARDVVVKLRAALGLSTTADIPEYCLTMIKHPEIFRCQMDMGTVIFKGFLPTRERELAVLRIAWLLRAPYEWGEHVAIGRRAGITQPEIERIIQGSTAPGWSEHEAAILRGVEELLSDQAISDATWAALARTWSEAQLIEFPMMVGQYFATALVQNALRIRLTPGNPGLTHR